MQASMQACPHTNTRTHAPYQITRTHHARHIHQWRHLAKKLERLIKKTL